MNIKNIFLILILFTTVIITTGCRKEELSDAYGNFEADEILISSELAGKITVFKVNEGDVVKENQTIGVIDSIQLQLTKKELELQKNIVNHRIKAIEREMSGLQITIETLKKNQERIHNLVIKNIATVKEKEEIDGQIKAMDENYKALSENKNGMIYEIDIIDVQIKKNIDQINKSKILSPVKGTIIGKYKNTGEYVIPGQPLVKIADLERITLKAYVIGIDLSRIKLGQNVQVLIDDKYNRYKEYDGIITHISDKAEFTPKIVQTRDERTQLVYGVKITVENDGYIKIGMPGEVNFIK